MKLISFLALISLVFIPRVEASQARLLALGLDKLDNEGSYYIDDVRNIFFNPAQAYEYGNTLVFDWGAKGEMIPASMFNGSPDGGEVTMNTDKDHKPQGGFLMRMGDYVVGAHLGNESNTSAFLRLAGTSNAAAINFTGTGVGALTLPSTDNQLDLFLASRSGDIRWGANLVYVNNKDDNKKQKERAGSVRLGARTDAWQAHAVISFMQDAENVVNVNAMGNAPDTELKQEFDGSLGLHIGGSYELTGNDTLYGYVKTFKWDQKDSYDYTGWTPIPITGVGTAQAGKTGTSDGSLSIINLGWGHRHSVGESGTAFVNLYLRKVDVELKLAEKVSIDVVTIPLTFGYEGRAREWLILRGSITQNIYGKRDNKNLDYANLWASAVAKNNFGQEGKGSLGNQTKVRAGAGLVFGNLEIDGLLGLDSGNMTDSFGFNDLFSRVGMTYSF